MMRLSEQAARLDLRDHGPEVGARADAYWAARWGWSRDEVARLRVGYTHAEVRAGYAPRGRR